MLLRGTRRCVSVRGRGRGRRCRAVRGEKAVKPFRVFIADEELGGLERLHSILRAIPGIEVVGEARNGEDAERAIVRSDPDLAVLGARMPRKNGLQLAASLREEGGPEVVLISADESFAVDAYAVEAVDYILKPAQFSRVAMAVERARRLRRLRQLAQGSGAPASAMRGMWVTTRSGSAFVAYDKVVWVEAQREYVLLHTDERDYIVRRAMKDLEDVLLPSGIARVHRSRFVRLSKIVEIRRGRRAVQEVVLEDGTLIPVGAKYAAGLSRSLSAR
nr:LytTR family DNA-binding domain-containing protein [Sphingomonas naasensis]